MAVKKKCSPEDIGVKAFFLGIQAENADWLSSQWNSILNRWVGWRQSLYPDDGISISPEDKSSPSFRREQEKLDASVERLFSMFESETPKFTPRYLGHMVSETSLPALLGHLIALLHNPNNTTKEVSKVGTEIEREAIADLLEMVGFSREKGRGHFTSGGTVANLEAVWRAAYRLDRCLSLMTAGKEAEKQDFPKSFHRGWHELAGELERARKKKPGSDDGFLRLGAWKFQELFTARFGRAFPAPCLLVPASAHFSWPKIATLLGIGSSSVVYVPLDAKGHTEIASLRKIVSGLLKEERPILGLVSVLGSTELGAVDGIHEIQDFLDDLKRKRGIDIWHHVDAAYGGYFTSLLSVRDGKNYVSKEVFRSLYALRRVNSITLDPHKLGYVPYACGAILVKDEFHYRSQDFSAPYLMKNASIWMHTIEGSRGATGAAATWMTNKTMGVGAEGYGRVLERGIKARERLVELLAKEKECIGIVPSHDLNILCVSLCRRGERVSGANRRTAAAFALFQESPNFSVSKTSLAYGKYKCLVDELVRERDLVLDDENLLCLRIVLMNPFTTTREAKVDFIEEFVRELLAFEKQTGARGKKEGR